METHRQWCGRSKHDSEYRLDGVRIHELHRECPQKPTEYPSHLEHRQVPADAEVRTGTEGEVGVPMRRLPGSLRGGAETARIEPIRVGPETRIPVEVVGGDDRPVPHLPDPAGFLDLFDRLAEDDDERRRAFRWVLGLILVRKKLLKLEGTAPSEEGTRFMLRRRGSDPDLPPIELLDPELSEDDARAIAEELGEIMADDESAA